MGALSSFAMLALTHHLIVQWSARQVLRDKISWLGWYDNYELLGDDIVLFDPEVAKVYLSVMKSIGLVINESKSVIASKAVFEFAKVTGFKGMDVSALSWKMFISQPTMMGRVNIVFSLLRRNIIFKHPGK